MVGNRHQRLIAQILQFLGVLVENLARWRQLDGFSGAVEQAVAIFLLQLADLRAHRRLRTEYFFPGAGKTALPRYFEKRDELIEVHCCAEL